MDKRFRLWMSKRYDEDKHALTFAMKAIDAQDHNNDAAMIAVFFVRNEEDTRGMVPGWVGDHQPSGSELVTEVKCEFLDGRTCRDHMKKMSIDWVDALITQGDTGVWDMLFEELEDLLPKEKPV